MTPVSQKETGRKIHKILNKTLDGKLSVKDYSTVVELIALFAAQVRTQTLKEAEEAVVPAIPYPHLGPATAAYRVAKSWNQARTETLKALRSLAKSEEPKKNNKPDDCGCWCHPDMKACTLCDASH